MDSQLNESIVGKGNISAKIIKDSITKSGQRIRTFELEFHRFILPEFATHRMFSKNSASTRAIPVATMIDLVTRTPAKPIHWGLNEPGMQSNVEMDVTRQQAAESLWDACISSVISYVRVMADKTGINGHKQWVGRWLETATMIKIVCTFTEDKNFYALRYHKDAQPEIRELARVMIAAEEKSTPELLKAGEWHLPYIATKRIDGKLTYWSSDDTQIDLDTARKISASCCAQASYRRLDDTIEKALGIFEKLKLDGDSTEPRHASPVEHQATPMDASNIPFNPNTWQNGVTHVRRDGSLWSGNLRGWVQYRQLIPNEAVW